LLFTAVVLLACGGKTADGPVASDSGAVGEAGAPDAALEAMPFGANLSVGGMDLVLSEMPFATAPSSGLVGIQTGISGNEQSLLVISVGIQAEIGVPVHCDGAGGQVSIWLTGGGYGHDAVGGSCSITFEAIGNRSGEETSGTFSAILNPTDLPGLPAPEINQPITITNGSFRARVP
jgi:hypothetical protein